MYRVLVLIGIAMLVITSCSQPITNVEDPVFNYLDGLLLPEYKKKMLEPDYEEFNKEDYNNVKNYIKGYLMTNDSIKESFSVTGVTEINVLPKVLLSCYIKKLKNQPYHLKEELTSTMELWTNIQSCRDFMRKKAADNYETFSVGDSITVKAPYYSISTGFDIDIQNTFCGDEIWNFNMNKDELYHTVLVEKKRNSRNDYEFSLKILYLNDNPSRRSGNDIALGDTIDFTLNAPILIEKFKSN